jgi:hypothetical protein
MNQNIARLFTVGLTGVLLIAGTVGCDQGSRNTAGTQAAAWLSFTEASQGLPTKGQWRQGIDFSDLNGDGNLDILAPPSRNGGEAYERPMVWYGDGEGQWKESPLSVPDTDYFYGGIAASDFDGNGIPDIGLAMHALGLKVLRTTEGGTYRDFSTGLPPFNDFASRALVWGDFDGDGVPDMAAVSEGPFGTDFPEPSGIRVCYRDGEKWTCEPVSDDPEVGRGLFADQIVAGDVNGDGKMDLAIAPLVKMKNLVVWLNEGEGRFRPFNEGLVQEHIYFGVALKDLNGDGRDDVIGAISGFGRDGFMGIKAFLSTPDGFEDTSRGLPEREGYKAVVASDLDGDGKIEIIGGTSAGGLKVFKQQDDRWEAMETTGLPETGMEDIYGLYCRDLNHDGHEDLIVNFGVPEQPEGGIRVFFNQKQKP